MQQQKDKAGKTRKKKEKKGKIPNVNNQHMSNNCRTQKIIYFKKKTHEYAAIMNISSFCTHSNKQKIVADLVTNQNFCLNQQTSNACLRISGTE